MPIRLLKLQQLSVILLLSGSLAACSAKPPIQVQISHSPLPSSQQRFLKPIVMQKLAMDRRGDIDRIGHSTITIFLIEDRTAKPNPPLGEAIATQVKEALESAGYEVRFEDLRKPYSAQSSKLTIDIKEFYFTQHVSWWPFLPLSGEIILELRLENAEGKTVYDKTFEATGSSFNFAHDEGFDIAIKEALTKILNKIVLASLSQDFQKAMQ